MPRKPIVPQVEAAGDARGPDREADFRDALARWASGVAVLALRDEGALRAMTVTAFAGVSLRPPLVMVAVGEHTALAPLLVEGEPFALSVLAAGQRRWAGVFADVYAVDLSGFPPAGDAILGGCIAAFVCRVAAVYPAGDHRLVVAHVERIEGGSASAPLVYFDRAYRALESAD